MARGISIESNAAFTPPENPVRSRNISAAPVRTSDAWRPGIISVRDPLTFAASACSTCGSVPLVLAPPMNKVGVLMASASALEKGGRWSFICPISVVALSRSSCFGVAGSRFQAPGPSSASMKICKPPSMSPLAITSAEAAMRAASGEGPGLNAGSSVASSSPPGSARISLRSKSGRRWATRNRCARRGSGPSGRPVGHRAAR